MKKKNIIIVAAVGAATVGIIVTVLLITSHKNKANPVSEPVRVSSEPAETAEIEDISENVSSELTVEDDGTGLKPDESGVSSKPAESEDKVPKTATPKTVKTEKAPVPQTVQSSGGYVQDADPNTGISWDGKSPIIYTYPDGNKGTEKKSGASYEVSPGLVRYYYPPDAAAWDGKCSHCGKPAGDGKNGTCVRWLMGDMNCPNCGEFVPGGQCHSCK